MLFLDKSFLEVICSGEQDISVAKWHKLATEELKNGKIIHAKFRVNGKSMEPFIRYQRDEVTLEPATMPLHRGDIVLFEAKRLSGNYVLHRVIKTTNGVITTCGIDCPPDPPIPEAAVIGTVAAVRRGNYVIKTNSPLWRAAITFWVWIHPFRKLFFTVRSTVLRFSDQIRKGQRAS